MNPSFDIIIIGAGVTGLSCAAHLQGQGRSVALVESHGSHEGSDRASFNSAGLIFGGQSDNFTRVSHAHGAAFARELWTYGDYCFDQLTDFLGQHEIPWQRHRRLRLITSAHELKESTLAVEQLKSAGFRVELVSVDSKPRADLPSCLPRVVAIQDDGDRGGWVDPRALLSALDKTCIGTTRINTMAMSVEPGAQGVIVRDHQGQTFKAEIVVVAAHLHTGALLPALHDVLISVAEQWCLVETPDRKSWSSPGIVFSANHGYEWGVTVSPHQVVLGGGRYLRPLAGIEAKEASVLPKITAHLIDQAEKTYPWGQELKVISETAGLDCRPCDELPVIGPMYGEPRVLLAAGYMGAGLTMGYGAGKCLSELVLTGRSSSLPRRLWPERLRSLPT